MNLVNSLEELTAGHYALLRVDPNTGTPVDENGQWLKCGAEEYIAFDDQEEAVRYAQSRLEDLPLSEWMLFDIAGNQMAVICDREKLMAAAEAKPRGFWKRIFG